MLMVLYFYSVLNVKRFIKQVLSKRVDLAGSSALKKPRVQRVLAGNSCSLMSVSQLAVLNFSVLFNFIIWCHWKLVHHYSYFFKSSAAFFLICLNFFPLYLLICCITNILLIFLYWLFRSSTGNNKQSTSECGYLYIYQASGQGNIWVLISPCDVTMWPTTCDSRLHCIIIRWRAEVLELFHLPKSESEYFNNLWRNDVVTVAPRQQQ